MANVVSGGARVLDTGRLHASRLAIGIALAVMLGSWALLRVRKQWNQEASGSPAPASAEPFDFATEWRVSAGRPRARWLRWVRWGLTTGMVVLAVLTVASQWGTLRSGLDQLGDLKWGDLRWAIYAEALALISFAQLTRLLLASGGVRLRFGSMLGLTLASNAMALTLPAGPAWAATFSFDQIRRRGVRSSLSAYALAVTWVFSAVALVVIALVGIDLGGSVGPAAPFRIPATVAMVLLAVLALLGVVAFRGVRSRERLRRQLAHLSSRPQWSGVLARLEQWVGELTAVRLPPRVLVRCLSAAVLNWIWDCGCLVFSIIAVGGHVPWQGVLAIYGLSQLAAALPIAPGGIGVVEGTLSALLIAYHLPAATAVAAVILYRIISFWILLPLGWGTVGALVLRGHRGRAAPRVTGPLPLRGTAITAP